MLYRWAEQESNDTFHQCGQSKFSRPTFYRSLFEFQVLLQVIGDCGQVHHLVGLCEPDRIYLPQAHELGQGTEDGLHGALALALHVPALWTVHPFDVPFVFFAVVGDAELLLLCALAKAPLPYGATFANVLASTVLLLLGTRPVIVEDLGERDHLPLGANVMVMFPFINEIGRPALVGPVGRYETFQPRSFQKGIVLAATVARVRHAVLPNKALLPQAVSKRPTISGNCWLSFPSAW